MHLTSLIFLSAAVAGFDCTKLEGVWCIKQTLQEEREVASHEPYASERMKRLDARERERVLTFYFAYLDYLFSDPSDQSEVQPCETNDPVVRLLNAVWAIDRGKCTFDDVGKRFADVRLLDEAMSVLNKVSILHVVNSKWFRDEPFTRLFVDALTKSLGTDTPNALRLYVALDRWYTEGGGEYAGKMRDMGRYLLLEKPEVVLRASFFEQEKDRLEQSFDDMASYWPDELEKAKSIYRQWRSNPIAQRILESIKEAERKVTKLRTEDK
ncbi:MAG: hypothetical protein HY706_21385 [Candidatus Hydrogenedentes bacterium]|nr:hypothetical protein [Candidatus Hydrogenedentota bacterium]